MPVNGVSEEKEYITLSTFLTPEEISRLVVLSQQERITIAGFIRNAVLAYIDQK